MKTADEVFELVSRLGMHLTVSEDGRVFAVPWNLATEQVQSALDEHAQAMRAVALYAHALIERCRQGVTG